MKFKSEIVTQASGSIGGVTYAHNKGGMYRRARSTPTNPSTARQIAVRNFLANLVTAFRNTLTPTQQGNWKVYADNVTKTNPLGDQIYVSAINWFVGANVQRLQAAMTQANDAPTSFDRGEFSAPGISIDTANDEVDVAFNDADTWVDEDDSAMLVYVSAPQNSTINFFKGPYQFAGLIAGDSVTPPTTPAAIALPNPVTAGQRIFVRIVVVRADGRYSSPFRSQNDAS